MIRAHSSSTAREAQDHNRNLLHLLNHSEKRYPMPTPAPSQTDNRTANSMASVTEGDEGKNDGGGCDTEADNKESDDEHEDDVAPSDSAIILDDSQAGHTHEERAGVSTKAGHKRKRSVSFEGENLAIARPNDLKRAQKVEAAEEVSDTDDYAAVDLISDSEEVDGTIEKLEERLIIASEERRWDNLTSEGDIVRSWDTNGWDMSGIDDGSTEPCINISFFEEEYGRTNSDAFSNDAELYNPTVVVRDQSPPPRKCNGRRQDRFADPQSLPHALSIDDASGSSQEMRSTPYHWGEDKTLDPRRGKIFEGVGNGHGFPQNDSRNSQVGVKNRRNGRVGIGLINQLFDGSYGSSSGYDTDLGETTEEDETLLHRSKLPLRRTSQSSLRHKRSQAPKSLVKSSQKGQRAGPSLGSWKNAPEKPVVVMNKECTSLIVLWIPKEAQTKQRTSHRVASDNSLGNTSLSMSRPSLSPDIGYPMNWGKLGTSASLSLEYGARFARSTEPVLIPPQLLLKYPGSSAEKHPRIDEDMPSSATYVSQSEWSQEEFISHNEDFGENQGELEDIDCYLDFSHHSEGGDNEEHLAATTRDSSPPRTVSPQNVPTEAMSTQNVPTEAESTQNVSTEAESMPTEVKSPQNFLRKELATALHPDEYYQVARTPLHLDDTFETLDFLMDQGIHATNGASLSPEMTPSKKRRMSDGLSRAESISHAKAALAAMS